MKYAFFIASLWVFVPFLCQGQQGHTSPNEKQAVIHRIEVQEVIQTSNYTYLHGKENDTDKWLAVPLMDAQKGTTYYYKGGWPMNKFESKELNRTFEDVLFLGGVSTDPTLSMAGGVKGHEASTETYKRKAESQVKKNIKIDAAKDGVTIAQLFTNKGAYAGKTVKIKGEVTKYTPSIMNKNWIHLQDGTDFNNKFELTITSASEVKVGQIVTLEGKVSINKDLGYGYFFDVIMEEATLK